MDISHMALIVSGASLFVSLYFAHKQRGISAAANTYMDNDELLGYRLGVYIVNSGMDPTTLRSIIIVTQEGQVFRHRLRDEGANQIRLAQSEFHECCLTQDNSDITTWAKHRLKSAKVLDSYGESWHIKDFADIINQRHHHSGTGTVDAGRGDFVGQMKMVMNNRQGAGKSKPG